MIQSKRLIFIGLTFISISCIQKQNKIALGTIENNSPLIIKSYKTITFKYDNKNQDKFGFKYFADDESIGPKSIALSGDYAYISDVFHTSIKKVDLVTGTVNDSKHLSNNSPDISGIWLRDIVEFKEKVYAPSDKDTLYVFSNDLKEVSKFSIENGTKQIASISKDSVTVFLSSQQREDKSIENNYLSIKPDEKYEKYRKIIPIDDYTKTIKKKTAYGKEYKIYEKGDKNYFESEFGILELKNAIPKISLYGAHNIDFNSNTLVFFTSTKEELVLYIYKY